MPAGIFQEIADHPAEQFRLSPESERLRGQGSARFGALLGEQSGQIDGCAREPGLCHGVEAAGEQQLPDQLVQFGVGQQELLVVRLRDTRERAQFRVRDPATPDRVVELRQLTESVCDPHVLARGDEIPADAPRQPLRRRLGALPGPCVPANFDHESSSSTAAATSFATRTASTTVAPPLTASPAE